MFRKRPRFAEITAHTPQENEKVRRRKADVSLPLTPPI
jgi:hypothetical protein